MAEHFRKKNTTAFITIPKIANITRAVMKPEGIANAVFKNITGYTGNASFLRQYELFGNASADAFTAPWLLQM